MPPRARRGVGPATSLARKGRISRTIASTLEMAGSAPSQRRRTAAAASPARTRAPPQTRSQALPLHEPASVSAAARHGDVAAGPGLQAPEAAVSARLPARGASSSPVFAATSATDKRKLLRALLASVAGIAAALAISFVAIHSPEPTMPWQRLVVNPIVGRVPIDCLKRSSDSRLWCELVHTSDGYGLRGLFLSVEGDAECGVHRVEGPDAQAEHHCYDGRGNAYAPDSGGESGHERCTEQ